MYEGIQNTDKWFPVILVDSNNNGVTGKTVSNITVTYHFEASESRTTYSPSASDWKEAGDGEYWLRIGESEFTQTGKYQLSIASSGCQTHRIPIEVKQYSFDDNGIKINFIYDRIGTPIDFGSGANLSNNMVDIYTLSSTVNSKIGFPIDLGDGSTLADNFTSIAGKTSGASSFNRTSDSLEAISDMESGNLSAATLKDILFNREVTGRHANGKPSVIIAGTGSNQVQIHTTLDTAPGMEEYINKEEIVS